jgi:hypothetical protein
VSAGGGGTEAAFTVARVTQADPVAVEFTGYQGDVQPWELFDEARSPRHYGFDALEAERLVSDAGYQPTTGWTWTGDSWGQVVQRRESRLTLANYSFY